MITFSVRRFWWFALRAAFCLAITLPAVAQPATTIRYAGREVELTLNQVSPAMYQLVLAPLDPDSQQPIEPPPSRVVLPHEAEELLRTRQLPPSTTLNLEQLRIRIDQKPLTLSILNGNDQLIQQLKFEAEQPGGFRFRTSAPVLGLGEGGKQFDRHGAVYSMQDGWGTWDRPRLGSRVAVPLLYGTDGWALLAHHPLGEFDLKSDEGKFTPWPEHSRSPLVLYLIISEDPTELLAEYTQLVGPAPMPPKWAMGYMQSHRTLAGPDEVLDIANQLRQRRLPCDALIYLGTGYCPAGWNTGHGSVEFNPAVFDDPHAIVKQLHDEHFKVVLHQNAPPKQLTGESVERMDPLAPGESTPASMTISEYWAKHRKTFSLGVDGWWPDDGDPLDRDSRIARHQMYNQGPLLDRPNVRPWHLNRTGYSGCQRYGGWIWSGDVESRWSTLAAQISVGLNHSLSLSPFWGSDIGGFFPSRELTGELYVRWFQFGAFCSSFRAHGRTWKLRLPWGWNTGEFGPIEHSENPDASELNNPLVEPICRKYLELRYRLLPYNYTLCREAHDTGLPMMRAMWLYYPKDNEAVTRGDQYLWGRDLLVAPVTEPGATERQVYLPAGKWYDYWTNDQLSGPAEITRNVDLETLPLYVRSGTILPLDPVRQFTGERVDSPTTLQVYTGADGQFRWYHDDGQSLDYQRGQFSWTKLAWDDQARRLTLEPNGGEGTFEAELEILLQPSGELLQLPYRGTPVSCTFD